MKFDNKTQDKTETRKQTRKIKTLPFIDPGWYINHSFTQKMKNKCTYIFMLFCKCCSKMFDMFWNQKECKLKTSMKFCRDVMCTWPLNAESRSDLTSLRYCMMQSYLQYCEKYILDTLKENKHARSICSHILITWLIDHMISQLSWLWLFVKLKKTILLSALIKISPWSTHNGSVLSSVQRA